MAAAERISGAGRGRFGRDGADGGSPLSPGARAGGGRIRPSAAKPRNRRDFGLGKRRGRSASVGAAAILHRMAGAYTGAGLQRRFRQLPFPCGHHPRRTRTPPHPRAGNFRRRFHQFGQRHFRPLSGGRNAGRTGSPHGAGGLEQSADHAPTYDEPRLQSGTPSRQRRFFRAGFHVRTDAHHHRTAGSAFPFLGWRNDGNGAHQIF